MLSSRYSKNGNLIIEVADQEAFDEFVDEATLQYHSKYADELGLGQVVEALQSDLVLSGLFEDLVSNSDLSWCEPGGDLGWLTEAPTLVNFCPEEDIVNWNNDENDEYRAYYFEPYMLRSPAVELFKAHKTVFTKFRS